MTGAAQNKTIKFSVIAVTVFFLSGYVLFPLWQLVITSSSGANTIQLLNRKNVFTACFNSVLLSVISVAGSAVIGTYFAYIFHYKNIRFKRFLSAAILLPIAIPPIVGVMSFLFLLGDNGLLMKISGLKNFQFSGWSAVIILHLYSFYPLFYLFAGNALKKTDDSIIEAAQTFGAKNSKIFFRLILPQLKPALLGAGLLTFMASMASFSAPFIFAGSQRFLTTEIYYSKINGDTTLSAMLSLLLAVISIIVLFFFRHYSKTAEAIKTKGTVKQRVFDRTHPFHRGAGMISFLFGFIIILPVLSLFIISLIPDGALMQAGLHYSFSLHNYFNLFNDDFLDPFLNSLRASAAAVFITICAGLMIGHIIRRGKNIFKTVLEVTASVPYGIPGTVIAICLVLAFNSPNIFSFNSILVGTFWILPVAYAIRNLPVMTQAVKAGLQMVDGSAEEAAAALGAKPFRIWRSVTMPLIYPAVTDGALLVFINSFGEFVATVLLYNYSTKTMPIEIYAQMRLYNNSMAATYGIVVFLIVIILIYFARKMSAGYLQQKNQSPSVGSL